VESNLEDRSQLICRGEGILAFSCFTGEMLLLEQFCLMPFLFVRSKGLISMGFRAARAALRRNSGRTPYADPADAGFFFTAGRLAGEPGSFPGDRNSELSPHSSPTLGQMVRWVSGPRGQP
jgi:hypothetical protein